MLKLENIQELDGIIAMDVWIEGDPNNQFHMIMDAVTLEITFYSKQDTVIFPAHARQYHACQYIEGLLKAGKPLPKSATVIWC